MKTAIVSIVLTCAVIGGVVYVAALDNDRNPWLDRIRLAPPNAGDPVTAPTQIDVPRPDPTPRSPSFHQAEAPPSQPSNGGIYKCSTNSGPVYQDHPCDTGRAQAMTGGTVSTIAALPASARTQLALSASPAGGVAMIERTENATSEHWRCPQLRREIRWIDAQARIRSTAYLHERRRNAKREMYERKCPEMEAGRD